MQSISAFLDIRNALITSEIMLMSAELKECGTLFICFLDFLEIRYNCAKIHHCRICATDFMPPSVSSPERSHLDRVKDGVIFTGKHRQSWKKYFGQNREMQ